MPPKRRAIGRSTSQARKRRALRASESDEQRALRLENLRVHATETRSSESDQREVRLETVIEYVLIRSVLLRELNYGKEGCKMFDALKFKNETRGMCCASGKVKLPELHSTPEPLSTLLSAVTCVEAFLGKHPQVQFMLPNDIVRCNEHRARKLHADIQSPRANLSSCRIASTIAGRRSQEVPSNLFLWQTVMNKLNNDIIIMRALMQKLWVRYKAFSINTMD
ncbi:uncharacterized protein TNCV_2009571 [Trichonephila clavipes]|nr:uncharacterized protein TNCV_2009571 [Trichonephila clavipes]